MMVIFEASSGGFGSLFTSLGLNTQTFLLDTAAFLVTAYIVGKYIFPALTRALDAKKDELEAAVRLEAEAGTKLDEAKEQAAHVVRDARGAADEILATAKADAVAQVDAAREKARQQSERLVAEAREQLSRDVLAARKGLKVETAQLVAAATAAVLDEKLDNNSDHALITRTLETK